MGGGRDGCDPQLQLPMIPPHRSHSQIREITDVLRRCKHNGFPVLRDGPPPGSHVGGGGGAGGGGGGGGGAVGGAMPPLVPGPAGLVGPASAVFGPLGAGRAGSAAGAAGAGAGASGGVPGTCCGLITRQHLMVLLQKAVLAGERESVGGAELRWGFGCGAVRGVFLERLAVLSHGWDPIQAPPLLFTPPASTLSSPSAQAHSHTHSH